jgi:exodeoxyribonuclease VII small subunit
MAQDPVGDVEELGYEQARDELVEIVRRLEAGGSTLEEALALWERGEQLATVCERYLTGARARLDAAVAARDTPVGGDGTGEAAEHPAPAGMARKGTHEDATDR